MKIFILLDRSQSMVTRWTESVASVNAYVAEQKPNTKIHLAVFDNISHDIVYDGKAKLWPGFIGSEYPPRGGTPLYDSCERIMNEADVEEEKKTVLVVITDGEENASQKTTNAQIKAHIAAWDEREWEVVFLGANFDNVYGVGGSVGVSNFKTMNMAPGNFAAGMSALNAATAAYSTGVRGYSGYKGIEFSEEDKKQVEKTGT